MHRSIRDFNIPTPPSTLHPPGIWTFEEDWLVQIPATLGQNFVQMSKPSAGFNCQMPFPRTNVFSASVIPRCENLFYIYTNQIPGFSQWRKFRIQWKYDFYLSHVKRSRLSWLIQSQPRKFTKVLFLIAIIFKIHINGTYFLYLSKF